MQTIRWRLAAFYGVALTATIVAFGGALYVERRSSLLRDEEAQLRERIAFELDVNRRYIEDYSRSSRRVVTAVSAIGDLMSYELVPEVNAYLDGISDHLFLMDPAGRLIYVSRAARNLDPEALNLVRRTMLRQPIVRRVGTLQLDSAGAPYHFVIDTLEMPARAELRVILVAAQPSGDTSAASALLLSMLLVAPVILIGSSLLGYWLGGQALKPLQGMIREVEAIQDGRSLHRRLAVPPGTDELAQLGNTLNAMLGRIERSFVALRRFTADASHELKTPLMVLRAGVERSLTHPDAPEDVVRTLDETLRQVNDMTELVTNLLTLARSDEGRSSLVLVEADLRALLSELAETAEILGEEHGVVVRVELPDAPLMAAVEPGRIRQLVMNLLTNAVKYTPRGGAVEVVLESEGTSAIIQVKDTGIGIATGDLAHVFERFWRADPARSRTGDRPGVGLGLAIVKWIVDAHGGTIDVQSRPGRGTTFKVTLPLSDSGSETPEESTDA
jgi:two-component system OmpR family sensor kinase